MCPLCPFLCPRYFKTDAVSIAIRAQLRLLRLGTPYPSILVPGLSPGIGTSSWICSNPAPTAISIRARNVGALHVEAGVAYGCLQARRSLVVQVLFRGTLIRESSKSTSKTVAKKAEQERRRELEAGFNNIKEIRQQRIRSLEDIIDEYLVGYRLRYRSATFAEYALGHVSRLLGAKLIVDIDEATVLRYQESRLRERAAPKSINEEVRFLSRCWVTPASSFGLASERRSNSSWLSGNGSARPSTAMRRKASRAGKEVTESTYVPGIHAGSKCRPAGLRNQDSNLGPNRPQGQDSA